MLRTCVTALAAGVIVTVLSVPAYAQNAGFNPSVNNGGGVDGADILKVAVNPMSALKRMSLLDPERFTMKNQYIMNFTSSGGNGSMLGMYINSMEYRFESPIIMRMKVAYQTQNTSLFGGGNEMAGYGYNDQSRVYMPSFDLIYQPTDKTTVSFHYRDYSGGLTPFGYYNRGFGGLGMSRYDRRSMVGGY